MKIVALRSPETNPTSTMRFILIPVLLLFSAVNPAATYAQDMQVSDGIVFDGEPFIAVNPFNSAHLVVAWMGFDGLDLIQIKTRVSEDGGATWAAETAIPHIAPGYTCADPSMAWDSEGNLFLSYIDYHPAGISGKAIVRRSTDGGYSWEAPAEVIDAADDGTKTPVDRPWLVIDRSGGPRNGFQYVTTKPAPWIPFPNRNYLIVSTDGSTFGDWRYIDTIGWQIGDFIQAPMAAPVVGADGVLHVAYPAWEWTENLLPRFVHASSDNGGASFTYHEMLESTGGVTNTDTSAKVGYQLISNPANPDHLAFLFIFRLLGDNDVFLIESLNGGITWTSPLRINDDPAGIGVMQDLVWADFDNDGDLMVSWRDRRNASDTGYAVETEIWGAVKWKDSLSFSPNFPISSALAGFDSVLYGNGNDFMSLQMENDTLYAAWGDTRDGLLEIWFARKPIIGTGTAITQSLGLESPRKLHISPNPASGQAVVTGAPFSTLQLFDQQAQLIRTWQTPTTRSLPVSLQGIPAGTYYVVAKGTDTVQSGQLIITNK